MSGETGTQDIHIRITCPHCRKQFQKTAAWIKDNDYVRCDFCREAIGLAAYKRQIALAQARSKASAPATAEVRNKAPAPTAKPRSKASAPAAKRRKPKR